MDWCPKLSLCRLIKGRELALKLITPVYWNCKSNQIPEVAGYFYMESMGKKLTNFSLLALLLLEIKANWVSSLFETANLICILQHQGVKVSVTLLTQLSLRINWNIIHCKNKLPHVLANQFYSGREMREREEQETAVLSVCSVSSTIDLSSANIHSLLPAGKSFWKR